MGLSFRADKRSNLDLVSSRATPYYGLLFPVAHDIAEVVKTSFKILQALFDGIVKTKTLVTSCNHAKNNKFPLFIFSVLW